MRVYKTYPNLGVVGVLESRTRNFLVRTSVPTECPNAPIVWVNSIDQLVRAGTEVTHRRESRENRRTSRTHPSIDYIFYSYYVSPSLDALMPTRTRRRLNPGRAPSLARIVFVVFVAWLNLSLK